MVDGGEESIPPRAKNIMGVASENGKYCTLKGSDQMQVTLAAYFYSNMVGPLLGKNNRDGRRFQSFPPVSSGSRSATQPARSVLPSPAFTLHHKGANHGVMRNWFEII